MSNCIKKLIFHLKLLNTGFVANDKWRQVPGFDMLHHIYFRLLRTVRTKGYSTDLLDPTQVESKKCSQIQWPVPSINAEPVDIFLGEE